jgi:tetratricopeptide (TPR) repeat protein
VARLAGRRPARAAFILVVAGLSAAVAWQGVRGRGEAGALLTGQSLTGNYLAARHARASSDAVAAADYFRAALRQRPDDPVLLARTTQAQLLAGRVSDGVALAQKLLAIEPDNPLARLAVAVGKLQAGRPAEAEAVLAALPAGTVAQVAGPLLRAWALFGERQPDAARAALEPLKAIPSAAYLAPLHAAWMLDAGGAPGEAAEMLGQVFQSQKEPWLRLAELAGAVYTRAGRTEDAARIYERYLAGHGAETSMLDERALIDREAAARPKLTTMKDGAAEGLFDAAGVLARQNQRDAALTLAQLGLWLKPDFPALRLVTADLMESFERLADANQVYAGIDRASPLAWVARLATARNLDRLDRSDEAAALLRQMAKERPASPEPLIQLGDQYRRLERYGDAVKVYDEAAARIGDIDRRYWRFLYARGIALERIKDWPRAEADLKKALEFEPNQPFVLNYLGYSWVEQGRNLEQAEEMLTRAVALRPNDGYIVDSLGWVYYRLGRYPEAIEKLERAVELKPEDPVINDHLGDAYWAAGRQREARFQWRAALSRDPEPELRQAIEGKLSRGIVREASVDRPAGSGP